MSRLDSPLAIASEALPNEGDPPVTVCISRRIRSGSEAEFEAVMREMISVIHHAPGHMSTSVFRASDDGRTEYRVVFKFDRTSHLQAWEKSAQRRAFLDQIEDLLAAPLDRTDVTGLEAWFTLPGQPTPHLPSRHRVALVTWLGVYIVGVLFALTVNPVIGNLAVPLRVLVHSSLFVPLMLYGVLPRLTRLFRGFLYPREQTAR